MRLIMRKHSISNTIYGSGPVKEQYDKLVGEKGELIASEKGQIGDTGVAGVFYELKAFDPTLKPQTILVHSIKVKGNAVTVKSANGNTFVFDKA